MNTLCRNYSLVVIALVSGLLVTGCNHLVYNPFITPPPAPLQKGEGQLAANANVTPQIGGFGTSVEGGGGLIGRYAFSRYFTLQTSAWSNLTSIRNLRLDGASLEAIVMMNDSTDPWRVGFMPRVELMFNGFHIDGQAGFFDVMAWAPQIFTVRPYLGLGVGYGTANSTGEEVGSRAQGYAVTGNLGASIDLLKNLSLTGEVVGVVQMNNYDHSTVWFALPSAGLVWHF